MVLFVVNFLVYSCIDFNSCPMRFLRTLGFLPMHLIWTVCMVWTLYCNAPVLASQRAIDQQVRCLTTCMLT